VKIFTVRFFSAHGKEDLCRASSLCRTEKKTFGKKIFCRAFLPQRTAKK
jgi:hypothetical protein